MLTRELFLRHVNELLSHCENDAARYKAMIHFYGLPYDDPSLAALRPAFWRSDIVAELCEHQRPDGSFGPLMTKDYAAKDKFPTTMVALERCLYIGLTLEDRDILTLALDYLEDILRGESPVKLYNRNERAVPWQFCEIAAMAERIRPNNPHCDRLWSEWFFIASRAFEDGEYSHERDKRAQHEALGTREDRLVPLPIDLLLSRRADMPPELESAMLHHYGQRAYLHGHFWDKPLTALPDNFVQPHTRRYFHTIKYINRFRDTAEYLSDAMDWLLSHAKADGLWDYGTQVKDPWGYFGYFACGRGNPLRRATDCTLEVLDVMKRYLDNTDKNA